MIGALTARLRPSSPRPSRRRRVLGTLIATAAIILGIVIVSLIVEDAAHATDLAGRNQPPSSDHLFGTDALGRDLFARTMVGLRLSLVVGTIAATISVTIALLLSLAAATLGRWAARVVNWLTDYVLALPHLVLLILLAFVLGGGVTAVIIAVGISHWPTLTRILRAKLGPQLNSDHVLLSRAFGTGTFAIARGHLSPVLIPQLIVGGVLLFPHAILHEAALSFLGLGIDPGQPAIGNLLSEAMQHLSMGYWWLALLPGLCLLLLVLMIDSIGENLRALLDPRSHHL